METGSAYSNIVSARSRRLRTIGIVLLLAVCAMVVYGYFGLMPSVAQPLPEAPASRQTLSSSNPRGKASPEQGSMTRAERVRKLRAAAALAYWGVCALLLVAAVFVAWLDVREISRRYVAERRAIWSQTADLPDRSDDSS